MSSPEEPKLADLTQRLKRIATYAVVLIFVFLLGLIPMWLKARTSATERDAAQRVLRLCQLKLTLASAALSARHGEYESARQGASEFFTTLRNQIDSPTSDLTQQERQNVKPMLNDRDNVITLLARGDPASADRLQDLFFAYQKALGGS